MFSTCERTLRYPALEEPIGKCIDHKYTAKSFEKLIQPIFAKVQILRNQINNAKQARDRLLPKLMSGELEL